MKPDETKTLTATVLPADADNKEVEWTSSNESVAEVKKNGRVIANADGTCVITCSATDGSGVIAECEVTVTSGTTPAPGNHVWVDLGLPSGTKWATKNIGASKPEEYGDYFAWGETTPKSTYNSDTYFDSGHNKYNNNGGLTELLPEDDAATANWGSDWQMPSKDQIDELINSEYTTSEWTTQGGVNGRLITSKSNGNTLFCPLRATATARVSATRARTATAGRVRSRAGPATRGAWASAPATSTGAAAAVATAKVSGLCAFLDVLAQGRAVKRGAELSPSAERRTTEPKPKYFSCTRCYEGGSPRASQKARPAPEAPQRRKSNAAKQIGRR